MKVTRTIVRPGTFSERDREPPSLLAWILWGLAVALYIDGIGLRFWWY